MPSLDSNTARFLVAAADHGVLATAGDGRPHLVPVVYAVEGDTVVTAVDHKPKSTGGWLGCTTSSGIRDARLLVDHYEDDWDRLWWVRVDGTAVVDGSPSAVESAARLLAERYPQYEEDPPPGPVIRMTIERVTGWAATDV